MDCLRIICIACRPRLLFILVWRIPRLCEKRAIRSSSESAKCCPFCSLSGSLFILFCAEAAVCDSWPKNLVLPPWLDMEWYFLCECICTALDVIIINTNLPEKNCNSFRNPFNIGKAQR